MQSRYIVEIVRTSRAAGRGHDWCRYEHETHDFDSVGEAKDWIKEQYHRGERPFSGRRSPIYVDSASRGTIQCGWIYSGKETSGGTTYLQDWVSILQVVREPREGQKGEVMSVDVSAKVEA